MICDSVTLHFSGATYPIDSMRMSASATQLDDRLFYGDIQSKKHILVYRVHVECHALPRSEATEAVFLHAVFEMADEVLFQLLVSVGDENMFGGIQHVELRLKRGWWDPEFSRFRCDIELAVKGDVTQAAASQSSRRLRENHGCRLCGTETC